MVLTSSGLKLRRLPAVAIVGLLVAGTAILLGWLASNESRGDLDPDIIVTPGIFVQRVVQASDRVKEIEQRTTRPREAKTGRPWIDARRPAGAGAR